MSKKTGTAVFFTNFDEENGRPVFFCKQKFSDVKEHLHETTSQKLILVQFHKEDDHYSKIYPICQYYRTD